MRTMTEMRKPRILGLGLGLLLGLAAVALKADSPEGTITSPSGNITVAANQDVLFSGSSTDSIGRDSYVVNSYSWTYGDGYTGTGAATSHRYVVPGAYTATLVVSYTYRTCKRMDLEGNCTSWLTNTMTASATRSITVVAPPSINSFSASAASVVAGKPVTLSWSTSNATSLSISGIGTVTGSTSVVVYPTASTQYTLTASNAVGSTTASATVATYTVGVSISPGSASLKLGETKAFSASVTPANQGVSWSASGGALSGSSGTGTTFSATSSGTFTLTATSLEDPSKQASATVTVATVTVGTPVPVPASGQTFVGGTVTFSTVVSNAANPGVTWAVSGGGSISASGVFSATAQGTYTVTATSVADPTKSAQTSVSVLPLTVSITPANATLRSGTTQPFAATVSGPGTPNQAVTWSVDGPAGSGTITTGGLYTAPGSAGTYTIRATSVQDGSSSATATISAYTLGVNISPGSANLKFGESVTFSAATTPVGKAVSWTTTGGTLSGSSASATTYQGTASGTFTVTAATLEDPLKNAAASVTVATVSVGTPAAISYQTHVGGTLAFHSTASNAMDLSVTWSVSGEGGTISDTGLFSASARGTFTVTAKSVADPTKMASTTVTVVPLTVTVTPGAPAVRSGTTQVFTAAVSGPGTPSSGVTWSVLNTGGGTITSSGLYTAPDTPGDYTIQAKSTQDGLSVGTAVVHVPGWQLKWKKDILYAGTKEIAEVDAQGMHVTLMDHLGSPRFVVNGQGTVEAEQTFLPFGEQLTDPTSASKFAKGFTNHEQTDPSGLIYMQARFYAPWYGRFLSPDPARDQHFEETQSWNIYSYVRNNPTMHIDPTGMADLGLITSLTNQFTTWVATKIAADNAAATPEGREEFIQNLENSAHLAPLFVGVAEMEMATSGHGEGAAEVRTEEATAGRVATAKAAGGIRRLAAQGKAWEEAVAAGLEASGYQVAREVTLKTPGAPPTKMDIVATKPGAATRLVEAKSSATAPLTANQKAAHPKIATQGAVVKGKGKPAAPGGTQIPPTKVEVVRPKKETLPK